MRSYPFIEDLFRPILAQSEGIKGRFFIAPFWASELNANNLDQLVDDSLGGNAKLKVFPLALLMPPVSYGDYGQPRIEDHWPLVMLFLKQSGITSSGTVQAISGRTGVTTHRVVEDWHDMRREALSFVRVTNTLVTDKGLSTHFYISQKVNHRITPITGIGNDKLAGVKLEFTAIMNGGCDITECYPTDFADRITIPTIDSHPKHKL